MTEFAPRRLAAFLPGMKDGLTLRLGISANRLMADMPSGEFTPNEKDFKMTVLTPENGGIRVWLVLSAISQLSLEIKTGRNFYGKRSVYSGLARQGLLAEGSPTRATKRNKMLALANLLTMCQENGLDVGEVGKSAQETLDAACVEEGVIIEKGE